jgi:hypothetical protein
VSTAPFAALFLTLIAIALGFHTATGFVVTIAGVELCGEGNRVVVQVLPHGALRINSKDLKREDLAPRLEEIFRTRAPLHIIFLVGDPDLSYGEISQTIDSAAKQVDYISVVTPSVLHQANWRNDFCLSANLAESYFPHPSLQ